MSALSSGWMALGEPVLEISEGVYAVTFPEPISDRLTEMLKRAWATTVPHTRLTVAIRAHQEATPIYDALAAQRPIEGVNQ